MAGSKKARIKKVGIVVRPDSSGAKRRARRLAAWLSDRGVDVLSQEDWADVREAARATSREEMMATADLVAVLGGDGSLLGMARLSGAKATPVVGIHHGDFGFLTDVEDDGPYATMEKVLAGHYEVEHRSMLAVAVRRGGRVVERGQALNDAVTARGKLSRMVTLEATVDGEYLATYMGDGLVIATPTGSTAYSLSAGGPIVEPTMNAVLITPISPHTLNSRPVVLPDRTVISVRVAGGAGDVILSLDGQEQIALHENDVVEVSKSRHRAAIVKVSSEGFFAILRRKLNWGARGEAPARAERRRRG